MTLPPMKTVLEMGMLMALLGTLVMALGFNWTTPAQALDEHVVHFDEHVTVFEKFLANDTLKQVSRDVRTLMVEAQTRLMCLKTDLDDLALLGILAVCDSLGVRRVP